MIFLTKAKPNYLSWNFRFCRLAAFWVRKLLTWKRSHRISEPWIHRHAEILLEAPRLRMENTAGGELDQWTIKSIYIYIFSILELGRSFNRSKLNLSQVLSANSMYVCTYVHSNILAPCNIHRSGNRERRRRKWDFLKKSQFVGLWLIVQARFVKA